MCLKDIKIYARFGFLRLVMQIIICAHKFGKKGFILVQQSLFMVLFST